MKEAFIMIGCPGSGKSTYVGEKKLPYVSRDQIRILLGYCGENEKYLGTREEEKQVTKEHSRILGEYMSKGLDFFVDDTNVNPKYRKPLIERLRNSGYTVIGVRVNTSLPVCIERRPDIPSSVIENMYKRAQEVQASEFDNFFEIRGE